MVTHQKEVYYRFGILHLHFTLKTNTMWKLPWMVTHYPSDGHPPTQGRSPTNLRMVNHQRGVCSIQGILHLDITYQTNTRWHLPWMVTHQPKDGRPPEGSVLQTWKVALTHYSQKLTPDVTATYILHLTRCRSLSNFYLTNLWKFNFRNFSNMNKEIYQTKML